MGKKKCPDGVEMIEGPKGGVYYLRNGKKVYCEGKKTSPVPMAVEGVTVIPEPTRTVKKRAQAKATSTSRASVEQVEPKLYPYPYSDVVQRVDDSCWPSIVHNIIPPNAIMMLNRTWWATPGAGEDDHPFGTGYDRDAILNENVHAQLFIDINKYAMTFDGQPILQETYIGPPTTYFTGESVQRFYMRLYVRKQDIEEVFRVFKDDPSVYFAAFNSKRLLRNRAFEQLSREKSPDFMVWWSLEIMADEEEGGRIYPTVFTGSTIRHYESADALPPGYDKGESKWMLYDEEFYNVTISSIGHPPGKYWTGPANESHGVIRYDENDGIVVDRERRNRRNREQPLNNTLVPTPFADNSIDHGRAILEKLLGALVASNRK